MNLGPFSHEPILLGPVIVIPINLGFKTWTPRLKYSAQDDPSQPHFCLPMESSELQTRRVKVKFFNITRSERHCASSCVDAKTAYGLTRRRLNTLKKIWAMTLNQLICVKTLEAEPSLEHGSEFLAVADYLGVNNLGQFSLHQELMARTSWDTWLKH